MSPLVAAAVGLVVILVACATLPPLRPRASPLALVMLLAMLPALWAGTAAVMAWRAVAAAGAVRPDAWVRDDRPVTLARLPAVGVPAPREQVRSLGGEGDSSHYARWSRWFEAFRSGPVTFRSSTYRGEGVQESRISSHGWTCQSSSDPASSRLYELRWRRSPDGAVVAFDCVLTACVDANVGTGRPVCRDDIAPLVFRFDPYVPMPVRGSLRDALAGLVASGALCWLATRWLQRPWRASVPVTSSAPTLGTGPFREAPLVAREETEGVELRAFERAMRARLLVVALVLAAALVGSIAVLPVVLPG